MTPTETSTQDGRFGGRGGEGGGEVPKAREVRGGGVEGGGSREPLTGLRKCKPLHGREQERSAAS